MSESVRARSLSAIVVTYNSGHCIRDCLESIEMLLAPGELIVVDNGSIDDTLELVRQAAPQATVLETGGNIGFGRACTLGALHAETDVLLFVNPDVVVRTADLDALDEALDVDPFGFLVPLLAGAPKAPARYPLFPYRPWPKWVLAEAWEPLRPRELQRQTRRVPVVDRAWVAGTMFFVRRSEFVEGGGFDPRFFLYAEDVDLSHRYRDRGLPIRLTSALMAEHAGAASSAVAEPGAGRIEPIAWSILGALEYVSIWHGPRAASRAAALVLSSLRAQTFLLRALQRVPRTTRKRAQVVGIRAFLIRHSEASSDYCPGAAQALRSVLA